MANPKSKTPRQKKPQPQRERTPQGDEGEGEEKKKSFFSKVMEGGILSLAIAVLIALGLVVLGILALISVLGTLGFADRPALYGDVTGGGCYVVDSAFTATKTTSADEVLKKLSKYNNLQNKKTQVQKIIDKSQAAGINYYLLLDIWSGEQSFGNDDAAFGCGVYDGQNRFPGFDSQLSCAIEMVKKAINNVAPYNEPAGANTFTRLFYTYTGGMKENYQKYGYAAGPDNARIVIHQILATEEVNCITGTGTGPGVALVGDKLYPPLGDKTGKGGTGPYTNGPHRTFLDGNCDACAVDYGASAGTPVYAISDGIVTDYHQYTNKQLNEYRGWNINFTSSNGQVVALYAHVVPAGRLIGGSGNKIEGITKGEQIATVFNYPGGDHLHFEMKISGQTIGIQNGHNYQLDYFGKTK